MSGTVNQSELSRLLDVTPKTIRSWEGLGMPVEEPSPRRGVPSKYLVADVVRWREEQARLAATGDLAAMDFEEARRRKLAAEAATAELTLARMKREVVDIDLVGRVVGSCLAACRARLMAVGAAVSPRLELADDTASRKEIVDDAIIEALNEISSDAFEFGGDPDDGAPEDDAGDAADGHGAAAKAKPKRVGRR